MANIRRPNFSGFNSGRRLTSAEALEIFHAAHAGQEPYPSIAKRYGVSAWTVGMVARGKTHTHLFKIEWDSGTDGWYWIGPRVGGTQYRMRVGCRQRRAPHATR